MTQYIIGFTVYTLAMTGVLFLAFIIAKKSMMQGGFGKPKNKDFYIEESLNIAPGKTFHIINVKNEKFLVCADRERTSFLTKLENEQKTVKIVQKEPEKKVEKTHLNVNYLSQKYLSSKNNSNKKSVIRKMLEQI
ncbi:MAG: hypothetical protein PHV68_02580 [Candidatus Gastranaerophilales bacterium]|nr:hypothetical protein [Candidatus Gastranaerophilales bacterium]